jgi:hypothetical protein
VKVLDRFLLEDIFYTPPNGGLMQKKAKQKQKEIRRKL